MTTDNIKTGGCLCGATRYSIKGEPFGTEYCHCRMCQQHSGATAITWMDFRIEQISWQNSKPTEYRSSEYIYRGFCPNCGSTLTFRHENHPDYLTLTITSLDEPNQVPPTQHIYVQSQLDWFTIGDHCRRFAQGATK